MNEVEQVEQLPVEPRPKNYAVWHWSKWSKKWLLRGRHSTPQAAAEAAGQFNIVIDVVSDTMIWYRGAFCARKKPRAVPVLQMEKYQFPTEKQGQRQFIELPPSPEIISVLSHVAVEQPDTELHD